MKTYYKHGSWNAICDVCGFKYKAEQLKLRWDGLMVCNSDWEMRNPQDLIRIPKEDPSVPWTRPGEDDVNLWACSITGISAVPGAGTPGCMVPGAQILWPS